MNNHSYLDEIDTYLHLSVLVPIYNEADNIAPLITEIIDVLEGKLNYELIYVDDGSTDGSWEILQEIAHRFDKLRIIRHRRSYGQSVAILTGVKIAQASWIVTLDGDGQNDPADILRLFAILQAPNHPASLQMIAGIRRIRQDNQIKRLASRIANQIRRRLLHDSTNDTGCGLKLFSRQAFLELPHFNHIHRFLHALILRNGGQVLSLEVNHRPRQLGQSKYGIFDRLGVGIVDLLGVMWLQRRVCRAEIVEEPQEHDQ